MQTITATYDPLDNKLRISAAFRLDAATYARVKAAGFAWAPKQEIFVAPMWTPERADLCIELAGEIGDEDTTLAERAEDRADRFDEYREKRSADAASARANVERITSGIPLGQPILVGHHSEKHARKDAERIENGMRKAVQMWETANYWKARAAGAIRAAKYKELPAVRHRRIKGLEADARKHEKNIEEAQREARVWDKVPRYEWDKQTALATFIAGRTNGGGYSLYSDLSAGRMHGDTAWRLALTRCADREAWARRWLDHIGNRIAYERAMLDESGGIAAEAFDIQVGGRVLLGAEWCAVIRVNRSGGKVVSVTTNARYVSVRGIEEVKDYKPPEPETVEAIAAATKLAPLCNYQSEGCKVMTSEEWKRCMRHSDSYFVEKVKATETVAAHRRRSACSSAEGWKRLPVYLSDAKLAEPPLIGAKPKGRVSFKPKADREEGERIAVETPAPLRREFEPSELPPVRVPREDTPEEAQFKAMKEALRTGNAVHVVSAPQLFPTPPELAARMVAEADIHADMRILEPSAGTGRILDALKAAGHLGACIVRAVEINRQMADRLAYAYPGAVVDCADFLSIDPANWCDPFDCILMNPPFADGADVAHVVHAMRFLKPGGRLVAVMSSGVSFRSDRRTVEFRRLIDELGGTFEALPADTFKASGTGVNTVLLVVDRPEAAAKASETADAAGA
jgi:predicted RNA methylase